MAKGRKVSLLLVSALVLSLALTTYLWAQPMGGGMGMGPGMGPGMGMGRGCGYGFHHMMNLTPEQAAKLFDLKEKFRTDTAALRKEMLVKRLEMRALWQAEKPDQAAILAKQKELSGLRDQFAQKMVPFRLEVKKIVPQGAFKGMRSEFGPGMGGFDLAMENCGMGPGPGWGMDPGDMPATE